MGHNKSLETRFPKRLYQKGLIIIQNPFKCTIVKESPILIGKPLDSFSFFDGVAFVVQVHRDIECNKFKILRRLTQRFEISWL